MFLPIITVCTILVATGIGHKEKRQAFFTAALAITYLTIPTVTTLAFGLLPCDGMDNGKSWLRKDYSIDCGAEDRLAWEIFAWIIIFAFPVGFTGIYSILL